MRHGLKNFRREQLPEINECGREHYRTYDYAGRRTVEYGYPYIFIYMRLPERCIGMLVAAYVGRNVILVLARRFVVCCSRLGFAANFVRSYIYRRAEDGQMDGWMDVDGSGWWATQGTADRTYRI
jgi:hypothetical protein